MDKHPMRSKPKAIINLIVMLLLAYKEELQHQGENDDIPKDYGSEMICPPTLNSEGKMMPPMT
jgi:hypothetical protein